MSHWFSRLFPAIALLALARRLSIHAGAIPTDGG